jgi:hypothetical protein
MRLQHRPLHQSNRVLMGFAQMRIAIQRCFSVRVVKKESCFDWTVYSVANELLGRGTAETEHKARIDAFTAGMTYIDRAKGRSSPSDTSLHRKS